MAGLTLGELIAAVHQASVGRLAVELIGSSQIRIDSVAPLDLANEHQLGFLANMRYRSMAAASAAGALILSAADRAAIFPESTPKALLVCEQPYAWFAFAAQILSPAEPRESGRALQAVINPSASVAADARVEPFAVVEAGAAVGAGSWIGAGAFVGRNAAVGAQTRLFPGARIMHDCTIGARGILHGGAVIGADGFGFAPFEGRYVKIPQTGRVVVGDDVDIGANSTIDRGTMGDTVIEDGVKIDNQVQIGHNCRIGAHTVIAGCVGIAGSAIIGRGCQLGGAAMILGHLTIVDKTVISSGTLVSRSITEAGFYTGFFPLMTNRDWERNAAVLRQLSELRDRVRQLEQQNKDAGNRDP
jgi:UDP-3-O-[3-hydroxymyristoyl] glucosamine N-acyltransferase